MCMGLKAESTAKTAVECQKVCEDDPTCPIWQFNDDTGCWRDMGSECTDNARPKFAPTGSERLLHGDVNVIVANLTNVEIMHLHPGGSFGTKLDSETEAHYHAVEIKHCRNWCWSDIFCKYWQYTPVSGCYVDWKPKTETTELAYPMSLEGGAARKDTNYVKEVMAGEFIQHFCPEAIGAPVKVPKPEKESHLMLWLGIAAVLLAVLAVIAYFVCKPKPKKTRAIKRAPPPAPAPEPEPVMMYTYTIPTVPTVMPAATYAAPVQYAQYAQAPTYAAPMTTYAAPQATYAAPITTYSAAPSTYAPLAMEGVRYS